MAFLSVYLVLHLPHTDHSHWSTKFLRIDFIGAFTLVSAVFLLLFGLTNGSNEGWSKKITVVPLALAPVLFAVFVLVEAKVAKEPFAPGHVIFDPPLLAAYCANFFGVAGQMGVLFFIALFFQAALGMSATWAGLMFLPSTVLGLSGSLGGGLIMRRTGRYYWLTLTGYSILLLGLVPMVVGAGQQSALAAGIGLVILALGASICEFGFFMFHFIVITYSITQVPKKPVLTAANYLAITTTLIAIIANAAPEDTAVAIACSYLFRSLGTTLGISITTATLQQMLRVNLAQELGGEDRAREIEEQVRLSLDYIRRLDPDVAAIVQKCYAMATQWAFVPVAGFAVLAIVSSLFIKERKLDR
jgi:hypothetical protein